LKTPVNNIKTIFLLAAYRALPLIKLNSHRVFGWFPDLKRAKKAVEINECDMEECYYDYLIIEEMKPGIHCKVVKEYWHKWDAKKKKWIKTNKPKELSNVINFTIG